MKKYTLVIGWYEGYYGNDGHNFHSIEAGSDDEAREKAQEILDREMKQNDSRVHYSFEALYLQVSFKPKT